MYFLVNKQKARAEFRSSENLCYALDQPVPESSIYTITPGAFMFYIS